MSFQFNYKYHDNEDISVIRRLNLKYSLGILNKIVDQASEISGCPVVFLYAVIDQSCHVLASSGLSLVQMMQWPTPKTEYLHVGENSIEFLDLSRESIFSDSEMVTGVPNLRYSVGVPLRISDNMSRGNYMALWCVDTTPRKPGHTKLPSMQKFAELASDVVELIGDVGKLGEAHKTMSSQFGIKTTSDTPALLRDEHIRFGPDPLTRFLMTTLIKRPRVLSRDKRSYLVARAWRKTSKATQLEALKALKINPPQEFVELICEDLAAVIKDVHGVWNDAVVTSVPCGHSGPSCLAELIGQRLADKLGLSFEPLFEPLPVSGSSHPITNVRRPKMILKKEETRAIILVDDVATSGAHIAEAATLLSEHSANVWPVVWLAN